MQRLVFFATVLSAAVFTSVTAARAADRQLVFNFTTGIQQSSVAQANTMDGNTGSSDAGGTSNDKGQIAVDVKGVEPDGGLVVTVTETARNNGGSSPETCVVYPNTNVICGSTNVHPEEYVVLRTLSPKFFDPSALDANRHWQVSNPAAGVTINFTANPAPDGTTVAISAVRDEKATNGNNTHAEAKYTYDTAKLIPTAISEYQTIRQQNGAGAYTTYIIDTTATLASDSGIAKS